MGSAAEGDAESGAGWDCLLHRFRSERPRERPALRVVISIFFARLGKFWVEYNPYCRLPSNSGEESRANIYLR
jgi:hypothetical protein